MGVRDQVNASKSRQVLSGANSAAMALVLRSRKAASSDPSHCRTWASSLSTEALLKTD
jgi:hypothetical protein